MTSTDPAERDRSDPPALLEAIRHLVLAAQREGNRYLAERLRPLGLTPSWAEVVRVLEDREPLSIARLGELLICEAGRPSRLVARMCDAGLLARSEDPADARATLLTLTPAGRRAAADVRRIEHELDHHLVRRVPAADAPAFAARLRRLIDGLPTAAAIDHRYPEVRPRPNDTTG